jgi:hypothetical protein
MNEPLNEPVLENQVNRLSPKEATRKLRDLVFKPLLDACTWDPMSRTWACPESNALPLRTMLHAYPWRVMLGHAFPATAVIQSILPTFFHGEPDNNQQNKPRLDIVITFGDGESVRYHPNATSIRSSEPMPSIAMTKRYQLAAKLAKRNEGNESQNPT